MTDIVERLEAPLKIYNRGPDYEPLTVPPSALQIEARDEIVRLRREVSNLQDYYVDLLNKATRNELFRVDAEAERDRLREALEHIRHYAVRLGAAWAEARARVALKGDTP